MNLYRITPKDSWTNTYPTGKLKCEPVCFFFFLSFFSLLLLSCLLRYHSTNLYHLNSSHFVFDDRISHSLGYPRNSCKTFPPARGDVFAVKSVRTDTRIEVAMNIVFASCKISYGTSLVMIYITSRSDLLSSLADKVSSTEDRQK